MQGVQRTDSAINRDLAVNFVYVRDELADGFLVLGAHVRELNALPLLITPHHRASAKKMSLPQQTLLSWSLCHPALSQ
jgi:hypothetical protein